MKKLLKRISLVVLAIFLLMQMYRPARNRNDEQNDTVKFTAVYEVPKGIANILHNACYDCHSNNTRYPWYSYIQPARYFMERHIKEGKENLNFDEWGNYGNRKQGSKLSSMAKQIKEDKMPLASYTLIHRNAVLSETDKKELITWINELKLKDE